jgi:hypothetical protein
MAKARVKLQPTSPELRRWCVEMAMRWPQTQMTRYGNGGMAYGGVAHNEIVEADIIARSEKILKWVTS